MASDDEDDLLALRAAALASMKKKPAAEDAQPIPQLTSSGHSLNKATAPSWAEDDFTYDDHAPFQDHEPVVRLPATLSIPSQLQPQFRQPPPAQFPANSWPGPRPGSGPVSGPVPRGNFNNRFMHGRGAFPPNQRAQFGQNQRLPFGQRMQFLRNQHAPYPPPNQRLPFNPTQPPPPFGQNPMRFVAGPPHSVGGGGGGGNLIVINTVSEQGEQPAQFPGQRLPFQPGQRTFQEMANSRGGFDTRGGRGRGSRGGGRGRASAPAGRGTTPPPVESSSKPMLLRPQDKYCPSATPSDDTEKTPTERVHRKKKDKFSRYNSSDDESDDESEEESEDEAPVRRRSVGFREPEEEIAGPEDAKEEPPLQDQPSESICDGELSIVAMNSSQLDSDHEHAEPVLDEPVVDNFIEPVTDNPAEPLIDSFSEPVIDGLDEPVIDSVGDGGHISEPELDEEEEDRLLASPSQQSNVGSDSEGQLQRQQNDSENDDTPVRDESPIRDVSPIRGESPVREASPTGSATPVRDESFDNEMGATPVRDESPERDLSPERTQSPGKESSPEQDRLSSSHQSRKSGESGSDSDSESGDESGSDSDGSSSSSSSSGQEAATKSSSNSTSEGSGSEKTPASFSDKERNSDQVSGLDSESESDEDRSIRRLPPKRRISTSSKERKGRKSPSPQKPKVALTPEEQARLEARKRKFESRQEVKVTGSNRKISLKGIISRRASKAAKRQNEELVRNSSTSRSSSRTVQARTSVAKSNDTDSHCKPARRKVSIEKPVAEKLDSNSEVENKSASEEEEEDEDGGSRSWMREANKNAVYRKTTVRQSLPGSSSYRGYYRGSSKNGGYYRRDRESLRDNRPEVHYSSSDDNQDSDRKLISVVVPRSSAGTRHRSNRPREERNVSRSIVSNRKRTSDAAKFDRGSGRHSSEKSRRLEDLDSGSDVSGNISVVIPGDPSSKPSHSSRSRVPVHQRLGKSSKQYGESSRSRPSVRPAVRNPRYAASGELPGKNPSKLRIHTKIKRGRENGCQLGREPAQMMEMGLNWRNEFARSRNRMKPSFDVRRRFKRIVSCMDRPIWSETNWTT